MLKNHGLSVTLIKQASIKRKETYKFKRYLKKKNLVTCMLYAPLEEVAQVHWR